MSVVGHEIIDPLYYERYGYPHASWAWLRRHQPLSWQDPPGMSPFWAVTKYSDVEAISLDRTRFKIAPRTAVYPEEQFATGAFPFRQLLSMDPPEHTKYRRLLRGHFSPRDLEPKRSKVGAITDEVFDDLKGRHEADFVADVAAIIPLAVIAEMLGIPRDDWDKMFRLSNAIIASQDPEYRGDATTTETAERSTQEMFEYFRWLSRKRIEEPQQDFVTVLANAEIDGEPIGDWELMSYFTLLIVAGNETTRNAASGGLLALLDRPEELQKLRRDPSLISSAVEEIVRWVSPVIQFCRTAEEDVQIRDVTIREGEAACLFYPSANRDEEIFEDPFTFRVDREPNNHYGFGIGVHHCLGANLARMELEEIFQRVVDRFTEIEVAGPPSRVRSSFVGGIKRLPIRYAVR